MTSDDAGTREPPPIERSALITAASGDSVVGADSNSESDAKDTVSFAREWLTFAGTEVDGTDTSPTSGDANVDIPAAVDEVTLENRRLIQELMLGADAEADANAVAEL